MIDESNVKIKVVEYWNENQIVNLYKSADWWKECYDPSEINNLINGSFAFVIAVDNKTKKAIGMGRIISDGVSDAYIQDLVVLKQYRKLGIGRKIAKFLLKICKENNLSWVGLISEPNQDIFYEKVGFKKMKNHTPMRYRGEE